jgi:hypothetical protein
MEFISAKPISKEVSKKTFEAHFPEGKYTEIDFSEVPQGAMSFFENKSAQYIDKRKYEQDNFKSFFVIQLKNEERCYGAKQEKTYKTIDDKEELTYIYETDVEGNEIGYGELRWSLLNQSVYFKNKPLVGFTHTEQYFRGKGYGRRRLMIMNALSCLYYNFPLNSDTLIGNEAKNIWEKLVSDGFAKKYKEGLHDRYSFVK